MQLIVYPDDRLRKKSVPVNYVQEETKMFLQEMMTCMIENQGIGLAAPQVGVNQNMFVVNVDGKSPFFFINPQIRDLKAGKSVSIEGCLSIPGASGEVERSTLISVKYQDLDGKNSEMLASGLLATCIQHEFDHLSGLLFIDHISRHEEVMAVHKTWNRTHPSVSTSATKR